MIRIRGGRGLGDSLYVQSIARHLIEKGNTVEACSDYPDVFRALGGKCIVSPFRRDRIDRLAHYSARRQRTESDQFQDCCIQAALPTSIELRLDWQKACQLLDIGVHDRPVVVVQLPRSPMDRHDGYGDELLPDCRIIQRIINRIGSRAFFVQVGKGASRFRFTGIDRDLANQTSVAGLIDIVHASDGCLGHCSFLIPLAESLGKPSLLIWSRRGLRSRNQIIRQLTPKKVIHKPDLLRHVIDDCSEQELNRAADAFLEQIGSAALV